MATFIDGDRQFYSAPKMILICMLKLYQTDPRCRIGGKPPLMAELGEQGRPIYVFYHHLHFYIIYVKINKSSTHHLQIAKVYLGQYWM